MSQKGTRRQARELTLQVLFQQEFSPQISFQVGLQVFQSQFPATHEVWQFAQYLLEGINQNKEEIDRVLQSKTAHWSLKRLALVDLNLMRIAAFEILFSGGEVPPKVAVNEAIEISKKYGSTDSPAFINGVLDTLLDQYSKKSGSESP